MRNLFLVLCLIIALFYTSEWFWKPMLEQKKELPAPAAPAGPAPLEERKNEGQINLYHDNGTLKAERNYKNGKLEGIYRLYYENGKLKLEGSYKDDRMNGLFKRYNEEGELVAEELYQDNLLVERKIVK